jgi:hypothetical protein
LKSQWFVSWHGSCIHTGGISRNDDREDDMHYKKYVVRSPFFALKDPSLSEAVLAAFSGVPMRPVLAPAPRKPLPRMVHVKRQPR